MTLSEKEYYQIAIQVVEAFTARHRGFTKPDLLASFDNVQQIAKDENADQVITELVHYLLSTLGILTNLPRDPIVEYGVPESKWKQIFEKAKQRKMRYRPWPVTIKQVFDFLIQLCQNTPNSASWKVMANQKLSQISCFIELDIYSHIRMGLQNSVPLIRDMTTQHKTAIQGALDSTFRRMWWDQRMAKGSPTLAGTRWLHDLVSMETYSRIENIPKRINSARVEFNQAAKRCIDTQIQVASEIPKTVAHLVELLLRDEITRRRLGNFNKFHSNPMDNKLVRIQWVIGIFDGVYAFLHDDTITSSHELIAKYQQPFQIPIIFPKEIILILLWKGIGAVGYILVTDGEWETSLRLLQKAIKILDDVFKWSSAQEAAIPYIQEFFQILREVEETDLVKALENYKILFEIATDPKTRTQIHIKIAEITGRLEAQKGR